MKNRGFTLVELLAVILVLAIILLITIPIVSELVLNVLDARLISYDELINLDCDNGSYVCTTSGTPEWVYSTSYWTGSVYIHNIWNIVSTNGSFGGADYSGNTDNGVRPVIVLSSSYL